MTPEHVRGLGLPHPRHNLCFFQLLPTTDVLLVLTFLATAGIPWIGQQTLYKGVVQLNNNDDTYQSQRHSAHLHYEHETVFYQQLLYYWLR